MRGLVIGFILSLGLAGSALAETPSQKEESAGLMAMVHNDYNASIEHYTKAIALETDQTHLAQLYNQRGVVYDRKGSYEQAIADIKQALALKPDYALAYRSRSRVYFDQALYDRALADANKSVALADAARAAESSPANNYGSATGFEWRAAIYERLGQRDNAIADYRKALSLQPNLRTTKDALTRLGVTP
jgi:tetratricopeptide (TPR) repeat protein